MLEKTERLVTVNAVYRWPLRVVREHYLRPCVPCSSALCSQPERCRNVGKLLPAGVTHYMVPDSSVFHYFDILEMPELKGVIWLQTVTDALRSERGWRYYNKLRSLLKDPSHECVLFANEYHASCYHRPEDGRSVKFWQCEGSCVLCSRIIYAAALWYYKHCGEKMPIVIVADEDSIKRFKVKSEGVSVMTFKEYLKKFYSDLEAAHSSCDFTDEALYEEKLERLEASGLNYNHYLPPDVLEAGLQSGRYVEGILCVNRQTKAEAFVRVQDTEQSEEDYEILINGMNPRNRALHGDRVAVKLFPESLWKRRTATGREAGEYMPTGHVVGITQKHKRDYIVTFPSKEDIQYYSRKTKKYVAVPWDCRIPRIQIHRTQAEKYQCCKAVVHIDSWDLGSRYPDGHVVGTLGTSRDLEGEMKSLLVEHDISERPFSEAQMGELPVNTPEEPWSVDPEEQDRRDLRQTNLVFTIDPRGCEDVDDALSVRTLSSGNLELGVHIADVTHFVKPKSCLDNEARARATTYYLPDRRYDMLPSVLSSNVCSLLRGVDRYAMSVIWELHRTTYEIKSVWYGRSIIHSTYQLSYEAAQELLDGNLGITNDMKEFQDMDKKEKEDRLQELTWAIEKLADIASHFRAQRGLDGALDLDGIEIGVLFDDERNILDLVPRQQRTVHRMVAECMILANHWVARKIYESFPRQALLRRHPPPRQNLFSELKQSAQAGGFYIDTSSNRSLALSLDNAHDVSDPTVNKLLRNMATLAMSNALYFSTGSCREHEFHHYALGLDKYTHFTSPIRRYADIIVHRLLSAAIARDKPEMELNLLSERSLEELCDHINERHRAAKLCQRQATELFQCRFFRDKDADRDERCVADGIIYGFRDTAVQLYIPRYGIKGSAQLKTKDGCVLHLGPSGENLGSWAPGAPRRWYKRTDRVTSSGQGVAFRMFEHVTVKISAQVKPYHPNNLQLEIISKKASVDPEARHTPQSSPSPTRELVGGNTQCAEDGKENLPEEYRQFRQTEGESLYTLLEEMKNRAIQDLSSHLGIL
ncbi:DIS3-like exonuclease 1 [Lepus europaeus]|uniref:DIS3-like exonuclease 1 n=1 Tax=Lepus europaeus TaxID=9983 RepID=UPI002B45E769|nr:DIS3-like exonuclease 1 [Lepus europaeus]